jgi:hypothetical protein
LQDLRKRLSKKKKIESGRLIRPTDLLPENWSIPNESELG